MEDVNIVTTIDGIGIVEAKNDLASFTLTVRAKSEALEDAQYQAEEKVSQVLKDLKSIEMKLDTDITVSSDNFKLEHREGTERYAAGYQSISTITFTVAVDDNLNKIYKTCKKLDSNVSYPLFTIKDRETIFQQAVEKAATNVKDKLNTECKLLNIASEKLKIYNWHFGYEGYLPASASTTAGNYIYNNGIMGVTGPSGSIVAGMLGQVGSSSSKLGSIYQERLDTKLNPGMVSVRVPVRVSYVWNE